MTPEQFRERCAARLSAEIPPQGAFAITDRLARFVEARSHSERVDAFVDLVTWARLGWSGRADDRSYLIALACFLEGDRESADRVRESFAAMTSSLHGSKLFAEAGIPSERGFFAELTERILAKVLPRPREDHDASRIFDRLFGARRHAERFRSMPPELFARLVALLTGREGQATRSTRRTIFTDGFRLLAVRTAAQGLSEKLRAWGHTTHVSGSPFYKLVGASEAVVSEWVKTGDIREALPAWRKVVSACREEMARISGRLETDGVSVDIVYGLEVISICLKRMERMVAIMAPVEKGADIEELHQLLANLVDAAHRDQSVAELFRTNLALLIRKIVDRSGQTGEHYVAESRAVYRHILVAAAGGGLLTAFTAAVKLEVTHLALPLFVVGFLAGLNYAVSFLIMQAFGLILATKQPSMTAAALAKIVREERGDTREQEIVDYAARLCSSQLGAAISNVLVVFAAASGIELLWRVTFGRSFLNVDHAHYVLETLTPLSGGTLFYAAFTGVILYLGSVAGGWFDNWAVYHRIPQAIRESGFGRIFGAERMDRLSRAARRNFSGIGTNVTLGMMLGLAPSFGVFFGLPLDVRHVTLSTGTLALAVSSVGALAHGWSLLVRAIIGIGVMFVLNLGVSFSLSLWAAARAYRVAPRDIHSIGGALLKRILTHPGEFLRPPRR